MAIYLIQYYIVNSMSKFKTIFSVESEDLAKQYVDYLINNMSNLTVARRHYLDYEKDLYDIHVKPIEEQMENAKSQAGVKPLYNHLHAQIVGTKQAQKEHIQTISAWKDRIVAIERSFNGPITESRNKVCNLLRDFLKKTKLAQWEIDIITSFNWVGDEHRYQFRYVPMHYLETFNVDQIEWQK